MYEAHFKFNSLPFENAPDPVFFFDEGQYNQILRILTDCVTAGRGLMVIAGPIGSGKTTISHKLMSKLLDNIRLVWLAEPPGSVDDLVTFIAGEIGIDTTGKSRLFLLRDMREKLLALQSEGSRCLLIIDESHLMTKEMLEGVRILTNLEQGAFKLLQIVLLGQMELVNTLNREDMKAVKQRIASFKILNQMDFEKTREYVLHRLSVAGGAPSVFSDRALEMISLFSGGMPRIINSFCHHSLRIAYDFGRRSVEPEDVHKAAEELGLSKETFHYMLKLRQEQQPSRPALESSPAKWAEQNEAVGSARIRGENNPLGEIVYEKTALGEGVPQKKHMDRPGRRSFFISLLVLSLSILCLIASLWYYRFKTGF
ncbi:MAG: AAA family ATPase [Desulfobacteraceae bacterium]|jgi:general secretion pathway protein A